MQNPASPRLPERCGTGNDGLRPVGRVASRTLGSLVGAPACGVRQSAGALQEAERGAKRRGEGQETHDAGKDAGAPRRFAYAGVVGRCASLWSAPVIWRFGVERNEGRRARRRAGNARCRQGCRRSRALRADRGRWLVRQLVECASPLALWGEAERGAKRRGEGQETHDAGRDAGAPRRCAHAGVVDWCASVWSAPVLWRFGGKRSEGRKGGARGRKRRLPARMPALPGASHGPGKGRTVTGPRVAAPPLSDVRDSVARDVGGLPAAGGARRLTRPLTPPPAPLGWGCMKLRGPNVRGWRAGKYYFTGRSRV